MIKINKNKVKLKDVAMLANVSVGTVSRYINNHPRVSKENARKIQLAIDKLGYIPNRTAQNLAKGVSNNILLYIVHEDPILESTWLYELPIIQRIFDYLKDTNYSLQLAMDSIENKKEVNQFLNEYVNNRRADGLIILSSYSIDNSLILKLKESKFPFALIGTTSPVTTENQILFDNYKGINEILEHLYELGHRRIGFINGFNYQQHMIERGKAFSENVKRLGIETKDEWIKNGDGNLNGGFACMQEILDCDEQPTAIVCSNDDMAAGAMRAIKMRGLSIPKDYSITGFDNSIVSKVVEPSLTTVRIPLEKLADASITQLIDNIKDPDIQISTQVYPCTIVTGDSTSKPRDYSLD